MNIEKIKGIMDSCYQAKRIHDMLPPLPDKVVPSYIHILDAISHIEAAGFKARVSDISDYLHLPRPGVTRTIKEMAAKGFVEKTESRDDGRITYVTATTAGQEIVSKYVEEYFAGLALQLENISDEEANAMIATIDKIYNILVERNNNNARK